MTRKRTGVLASVAVVAAAGLAAVIAVAVTGSPTPTPAVATAPGGPGYSYYRSMMARYLGPAMMGGASYRWMMGAPGYRWMMGGTTAPGWMRSRSLPGAMMGTAMMRAGMMGAGIDPGKVMGRLWANAPGPRVSAASAARLGSQVPDGARVDPSTRTITFATTSVHLVALAGPAGGPDETFRAAGMVNPTVVVPVGSSVTIEVINADGDTAHGLVVTATAGARFSWMPMMTSRPAFAGSAVWFLGNPTAAGMHAATMTFTARTPGSYRYLCPVPGHARKGMIGTFTVRTTT